MSKTVFIKTYGCQMNVYDSDRMADIMAERGYRAVGRAEDADLVILNTCHIREKAAEKVYSELGRLRALKRRRAAAGAPMTVAVAGCVAQAEGREMARRAPVVDLVVGPQSYHRLPALLARARHSRRAVVETEFPAESKFARLPATTAGLGPSAFVTVQEGCDKFCTFCVVPYTRGAEFSRPVEKIAAEVALLAARGVREVTLLGQNVNAYHGRGRDGRDWPLGRLLRRLAQIEGLARLRYTTSHPRDVDDALIEAHREVRQVMPFLHLPVQSGSDRVLKAMNRRHSADDYRRIVARLRAARPDLALSSDFIVGFPGETEADFQATLDLAREIGFAQAYSFKYSARPGTPAADAEAQVGEAAKAERLCRLRDLLNDQQRAFNEGLVGTRVEVLVEGPGRHPGQVIGRSPWMQAVHLAAPRDAIARLLEVEILAAGPNSLAGRIGGSCGEDGQSYAA